MIQILISILFGIVEGITEWLPVSSTGHMILLNELVALNVGENPKQFYSMYEVVIQLGAILAVVVIFWHKIWPFGRKNNKHPLTEEGIGSWVKWDIFQLWFHILVSSVPAAVVGLAFNDICEELFYNYQTVAIMLIVVGVAFILIETRFRKRPKIRRAIDITYPVAIWIGVFQVIAAVFPGTSRSGATIIGALLLGVSRGAAAQYTFYLAIPVMFGASLLKILKFGLAFTGMEIAVLLIGMAVAFLVSLVCIRFLMSFVKKHDFKCFGYYRIVLGIIVLVAGFTGLIGK